MKGRSFLDQGGSSYEIRAPRLAAPSAHEAFLSSSAHKKGMCAGSAAK